MRHCRMEKLRNIDHLELQLDSLDPDAGVSLQTGRISIPQNRLDHLEVTTSDVQSGHTVNTSALASKFPSLASNLPT